MTRISATKPFPKSANSYKRPAFDIGRLQTGLRKPIFFRGAKTRKKPKPQSSWRKNPVNLLQHKSAKMIPRQRRCVRRISVKCFRQSTCQEANAGRYCDGGLRIRARHEGGHYRFLSVTLSSVKCFRALHTRFRAQKKSLQACACCMSSCASNSR